MPMCCSRYWPTPCRSPSNCGRQNGMEGTTAAWLETLQPVQLAELSFQTSDGHRLAFERATVPSAAQQAILQALGWPIPDRYLPPNVEAEPRRVV